MKVLRILACAILLLAVGLSIGTDWLAPHNYAIQFREHADEPPSRAFPLGTDELGRDRLSRLLAASRVSFLCALAAAVIATLLAATAGLAGGYFGGWIDTILGAVTDLFLSLPWLFFLLTLRALLPLNISPSTSLAATFLALACFGWPFGARVVRAGTANLRDSGPVLHARAYGCRSSRLLWRHVLPNLRPIISAQFWILIPVFLLTEANLGVLGLGIMEPIPSLGNMLVELQNYQKIADAPWILAPAVLLVLVIGSLHFVVSERRTWE